MPTSAAASASEETTTTRRRGAAAAVMRRRGSSPSGASSLFSHAHPLLALNLNGNSARTAAQDSLMTSPAPAQGHLFGTFAGGAVDVSHSSVSSILVEDSVSCRAMAGIVADIQDDSDDDEGDRDGDMYHDTLLNQQRRKHSVVHDDAKSEANLVDELLQRVNLALADETNTIVEIAPASEAVTEREKDLLRRVGRVLEPDAREHRTSPQNKGDAKSTTRRSPSTRSPATITTTTTTTTQPTLKSSPYSINYYSSSSLLQQSTPRNRTSDLDNSNNILDRSLMVRKLHSHTTSPPIVSPPYRPHPTTVPAAGQPLRQVHNLTRSHDGFAGRHVVEEERRPTILDMPMPRIEYVSLCSAEDSALLETSLEPLMQKYLASAKIKTSGQKSQEPSYDEITPEASMSSSRGSARTVRPEGTTRVLDMDKIARLRKLT